MNVLVYSHVPLWIYFHAETVELCLRHLQEGDNVFLLSCDGALSSCPANSSLDPKKCRRCRRQSKWTIRHLLQNRVVDVRLPFDRNCQPTPSFASLDDLLRYSEDNVPFGELVASQIVTDKRDCLFSLDNSRDRIHDLLSSAKHLYSFSRQLIIDKKIDHVYVWNGRRLSDGPVCFAAQNLGVAFTTHISRRPTEILFSDSPKIHELASIKSDLNNVLSNTSKSILLSGTTLDEASAFYNSLRYGTADSLGSASFSKSFSTKSIIHQPSDSKPILAIFTSSFWEYYGMRDWSGGPYSSHYDGLQQILSDPVITEFWDCHIRWHPNLSTCGDAERSHIDDIIQKFSAGICHYSPESSLNSYDLIDQSSAVLTFGSTIGIEACYYGKPSILLGRAVYEDIGACYTPSTHHHLVELLRSVPEAKNRHHAVEYAYYILHETSSKMRCLDFLETSASQYFVGQTPLLEPISLFKRRVVAFAKCLPFASFLRHLFLLFK